jgi:chromodomain-helicase-DNA-binding protein 7
VKTFVSDLICPLETNSITRNHSGLANPVSRGGRKSKKKDKMSKAESPPESVTLDNWMKEERYDPEAHLDPASLRRVAKNANRTLLRIRLLYYVKQEIIGMFAEQIDRDVPLSDLPICPPSLIIDSGPVEWWDKDADASLLAGTYKHGYEKYNIMRQDPALCFLSRCGPPDGSAVLAEICQEV